MDRQQAIWLIKDHMEHHKIGEYPHILLGEALNMAIAALSPPNEPLTLEQLREMTGLPADDHDAALWDSGFDLDDWDFGFVSDTEWHEDGWWSSTSSYYEYWLLDRMANCCVGYKHTEYNGRHYYMMYHS